MNSYLLERRIRRLEHIVYEKTVTRGNDSRAYTIWKLLRDEGPLTRPEIRDRLGWTTPILDMEAEGCVIKRGNRYEYNPDYNWEDVGVIPRTAQQELQQQQQSLLQAIRGGNIEVDDTAVNEPSAAQPEDAQQEAPSRGRRREPRAPREPRQREIKQNIFSRKFEEVKAAVDAGQNVNQVDEKGRTPLLWACMSDKPEAAEIVKYLLSHRANPDPRNNKGATAIFLAIKRSNLEVIKALAPRANLGYRYESDIPLIAAINNNIFDNETLLSLIPAGLISILSENNSLLKYAIRSVYTSGRIENKTKVAILDRCVEVLGNKFCSIINGRDLVYTISSNSMIIYNSLIKSKSFPEIVVNDVYSSRDASVTLRRLHSLMLLAVKENFKIINMKSFLETAASVEEQLRINPNDSVFSSLPITKESMLALDNQSFAEFSAYYIEKSNIEAIRKLVSVKYPVKGKNANIILKSILNVTRAGGSEDVIITSLRLLNHAVNPDYAGSAYMLGCVTNEYILDWAIDQGLGKVIATQCGDKSAICAAKLAEAGYKVDDYAERESSVDRKVSKIIDNIEKDTWSSYLEDYVKNHPEILLNDKVADAIEENDTFTASQLKRKIADLPKDVYDF